MTSRSILGATRTGSRSSSLGRDSFDRTVEEQRHDAAALRGAASHFCFPAAAPVEMIKYTINPTRQLGLCDIHREIQHVRAGQLFRGGRDVKKKIFILFLINDIEVPVMNDSPTDAC